MTHVSGLCSVIKANLVGRPTDTFKNQILGAHQSLHKSTSPNVQCVTALARLVYVMNFVLIQKSSLMEFYKSLQKVLMMCFFLIVILKINRSATNLFSGRPKQVVLKICFLFSFETQKRLQFSKPFHTDRMRLLARTYIRSEYCSMQEEAE